MHRLFNISLFLKGLTGVFEIILGVAAAFISRDLLLYWVNLLTRRELLQDPGDVFAQYMITTAQQYSISAQLFVSVYFLIHGFVKILLIYALLKQKLWAFPVAIIVFGLFLACQIYEYIQSPQLSLVVLSVLDIIVIVLTYIEYKHITAKLK